MKRLLVLAALAALAIMVVAVPVQARMRPQVGCAPAGCWPVYSYGDQDTDVYAIQYFLRYRGYANFTPTGYYGSLTTRAVENFQRANGIRVSGVVGARTWPVLIVSVKYGQTSDAVRALQTELRQQYGYDIPVTGYYGNITRADVASFQKAHGLTVNGSAVGSTTWQAIISDR